VKCMADTHNRHIISMKSGGPVETPQDIVGEYNGCSVPQYTRYPLKNWNLVKGLHQQSTRLLLRLLLES